MSRKITYSHQWAQSLRAREAKSVKITQCHVSDCTGYQYSCLENQWRYKSDTDEGSRDNFKTRSLHVHRYVNQDERQTTNPSWWKIVQVGYHSRELIPISFNDHLFTSMIWRWCASRRAISRQICYCVRFKWGERVRYGRSRVSREQICSV
jgi:hypothetical protein